MEATSKDSLIVLLTARAYLYHILHSLYGNHPDTQLFEVLRGDITSEAIDLFSAASNGDFGASALCFQEALNRVSAAEIEALDEVYTKIFIGPNKLIAPPWESVYASKDRILFSSVTLDVRNVYRSQGFIPKGYPVVDDTHIALELEFMAELGDAASAALQKEDNWDATNVSTKLETSAEFLDKHLLTWVNEFASAIKSCESAGIYAAAATFLTEFLKADRIILNELIMIIHE